MKIFISYIGFCLIIFFIAFINEATPITNNTASDYCNLRSELSNRPTLSGTVKNIGTERFLVHYTTEGVDAITDDYARVASETLEEALRIQVDEMGWAMPPPDCGEGGDSRFDLYIYNLQGRVLGYAVVNYVVGDNPNSDAIETYAAYGHLEITNDFSNSSDPVGLMRSTIAHEVHHNIQFGYDFNDAFDGLDEAGATWMETQIYPKHQDAMRYTDSYLYFMDLCLGYNAPDNPLRIYGEWILIDSIVQDYGANVLHEVFWRYRADYEGMETFYLAAEALGTDASNLIFRAGVRSLLRDFTLSNEAMQRVYVEGVIDGIGIYAPRRNGIQELGIDFMKIASLGQYTYTLSGNDLFMAIVAIRGGEADIFYMGNLGTVDLTPYDDAYIMVLNLIRREDDVPCGYSDWKVGIVPAIGDFLQPHSEVWDATRFEPPVQLSGIERYIGTMDDSKDIAEYRLFLQAGDIVNVYAGTLSGALDPYIILTDSAQLTVYVEDDDSGGEYNAFFSYRIAETGEYMVLMFPIVSLDIHSDYEVIIAINEPIKW